MNKQDCYDLVESRNRSTTRQHLCPCEACRTEGGTRGGMKEGGNERGRE